MAKNEALFQLIKSLSRSEKRYFKLQAARSGSKPNFVRLFDAIDAQDEYDEAGIRKQFEGETFIKQLHVTKSYLRDFILKCLRNFHAGLSRNAEVKDRLRNVEILFHKELYAQCTSELKRAESIARRYELSASLSDILDWKRRIEQVQSPHNYETFQSILIQQQASIETQLNTNRYWQLAVSLSGALMSRTPQEIDDLDLLDDPQQAKTLEARSLFYNSRYFRSLQKRESGAALEALFALVEELEAFSHRIKEDPGLYISSIHNLASYLIFQKEYDSALEYLKRARSVYRSFRITSENKTLLKHIIRTHNLELEIYRDTRTFREHAGSIETIEGFVIEYKNKMPPGYLISFWFQLANIHFMSGRFDDALSWINELLNTHHRTVRPDLHIQARMLNLMIHLEKQNLFVLRYFVDNTRRYLKRMRPLEEYELELLRFFSEIAQAPVLEYKTRFVALYETLFPSDTEPFVPAGIIDYIDYKSWIEARITLTRQHP